MRKFLTTFLVHFLPASIFYFFNLNLNQFASKSILRSIILSLYYIILKYQKKKIVIKATTFDWIDLYIFYYSLSQTLDLTFSFVENLWLLYIGFIMFTIQYPRIYIRERLHVYKKCDFSNSRCRIILLIFKFLFPLCHKNVKTYFRRKSIASKGIGL